MISPGVRFLLSALSRLLSPPLVLFCLLELFGDAHPLFQSTKLRILAYLGIGPLCLYLIGQWTITRHKRAAARLGAVYMPVAAGKWPGGLDMLIEMLSSRGSEYALDTMSRVAEKNGPTFIFRLFWQDRICTIDPLHIKQILASNFPNYIKGDQRETAHPIYGSGVFTSDGDMWKFHRVMARPFFTRDRISDFETFNRHADEIIHKMKESFKAGHPIDFQDAVARFTLDSTTEFLFGSCVNSAQQPFALPGQVYTAPENSTTAFLPTPAFIRAIDKAQDVVARRLYIGEAWKVLELGQDRAKEPRYHIYRYVEPLVEAALAKEKIRKEQSLGDKPTGDIGDHTTFLEYLVSQTQDPVIIRDQVLNMMFAGRDTSSCLLTFAAYMLSQHPNVLARLRDEILRSVGTDKMPSPEDLKNMRYLRAVLNETLRLFPPIAANLRESIKEDVWVSSDGTRYYIPPNTTTGYSIMLMQRDKTVWGEDALIFDPDRWTDHRLQIFTENPFIFLPFNAGPRICLGQQFAYNEISCMIIRLLQSFGSITLKPEAQPTGTLPRADWPVRGRNQMEKIRPALHITLYVDGGLWLTMDNDAGNVPAV